MSDDVNNNLFVVSWDMLGLDSCVNISDINGYAVWAVLKNERPPSVRSIVNGILLRARYNSQRHYEVYTFTADEGIEENDIREMFENDPNGSAELIRSRGKCLYSDRLNPKEMLIK